MLNIFFSITFITSSLNIVSATSVQFPYHVSVLSRCGNPDDECTPTQLLCSGSLLSAQTIITTRTCFPRPVKYENYLVRAGSNAWSEGGFSRRVKAVIFNEPPDEEYKLIKSKNVINVALVFTSKPFPECLRQTVAPLDLPDLEKDRVNEGTKQFTVVGWEKMSSSDIKFSNEITKVNILPSSIEIHPEKNGSVPLLVNKEADVGAASPDQCFKEGSALVRDNIIYGVNFNTNESYCGTRGPKNFTIVTSILPWIRLNIRREKIYSEVSVSGKPRYLASLMWLDCDDEISVCAMQPAQFICSGSLISRQTLITATSCFFQNPDLKHYHVIAGSYKVNPSFRRVKAILFNNGLPADGWNSVKYENFSDVAIVITSFPFPPNPKNYITPLQLPEDNESLVQKSDYFYTAWAKTTRSNECYEKGQWVLKPDNFTSYKNTLVSLVANEQCSKLTDTDAGGPITLPNNYICAHNDDLGQTCVQEGSGMIRNMTLYGVFSSRRNSCFDKSAISFNGIGHLTSWIRKYLNMEKEYSQEVLGVD